MSSSLTPKKNLENELSVQDATVDDLKAILLRIKRDYMLSAVILYQMYEKWTGTPDEWVEFYREELDLKKEAVSKMRTVGGFLAKNGLLKATQAEKKIGFDRLYLSIIHGKKEDPQFVLARAMTWPEDDFTQDKKDNCPGPDLDMDTASAKCRACGTWHLLPKEEIKI